MNMLSEECQFCGNIKGVNCQCWRKMSMNTYTKNLVCHNCGECFAASIPYGTTVIEFFSTDRNRYAPNVCPRCQCNPLPPFWQ